MLVNIANIGFTANRKGRKERRHDRYNFNIFCVISVIPQIILKHDYKNT
jgi:hypothetical protein